MITPHSPNKSKMPFASCRIKQSITKMFFVVVVALLVAIVILNLFLLVRVRSHEGFEARLHDDLARIQQRQSEESRALREEVGAGIQRFAIQSEQRTESLRTAVMQ